MTDQLGMFGDEIEPIPAAPDTHVLDDGLGDDMVYGGRIVSPVVFDVITRFLAGVVYRTETGFEKLPAAKRKTAERAARAAVDVFANETEDNDG